MKNKVSAIICCAGKGERAGFGKNKLLLPLDGAPAIYHTLEKFNVKEIDQVIVACSQVDEKEITALCAPFGYTVVLGGDTRMQTVERALNYVDGEIVLICDGARPYVSKKLIRECILCTLENGSAICAIPVTDTTAITDGKKITDVPDRNNVYSVQTPQGFFTKDIKIAYKRAFEENKFFTDDGSLYLRYIGRPHVFYGDKNNVKLTYKEDFNSDKIFINTTSADRVGFGVDVHSFGKDVKHVILCGEKIDCDEGLIAHSDGDVCIHALMDALLSACGLNDIGHYFPDTDDEWKNADSMDMLAKVRSVISKNGYFCVNAVICIQAEKPRISPHVEAMKLNVAKALNVPVNAVSVCAGTCEKLGFIGEGKGIQATATVLLKHKN